MERIINFLKKQPKLFSIARRINRTFIYPIISPIREIKKKFLLRNFREEFKYIDIKGNKFFLLLNPENKTIDESIFIRGFYEKKVTDFIVKELKSNYVFVDVGANIGYFTNLGASICKEGKVFGFEPIKKIYKQNIRSIQRNGFNNVELLNLACGSKNEFSYINISGGCVGSSTILNHREDIIKKEKVKIRKLDNVLKGIKRIDLIKIDVEGFESYVFEGGLSLLRKFHPKIIFEAWNKEYLEKVKSVIVPLGYRIDNLDEINYLAVIKKEKAMGLIGEK